MSGDHYWGSEVESLGLDDEMEEIELGERVAFDLAMERFAGLYTYLQDRVKSMELILVGRIAWPHQSLPSVSDSV